MGIGAAAAGWLLSALPTQLASRLDDLVNKVTSATTGQSAQAGSIGGDTSGPVREVSSPSDETIDLPWDETIDVTERAPEPSPKAWATSHR